MTMTIHLHWWLFPALLAIISLYFGLLRRSSGWDSLGDGYMSILFGSLAIAIMIGHFL